MIKRIFSGEKADSAAIIMLFSILFWLPGFLTKISIPVTEQYEAMPFYNLIRSWINDPSLFTKILAFILLLLQAYVLVILNGRFMLVQQRTFLPAFFFMSIVSFYPGMLGISGPVFASFFLIILLGFLFDSYNHDRNSYRFFEAGLMLGLASFFYAKMIFFLPFIWICSMIFRPFYWREYVMPLIGLAIPFILSAGINFLLDRDPLATMRLLGDNLTVNIIFLEPEILFFVITGILILLIALSSSYMLRIYQFRKIYIRNYYLAFFWLFLVSTVILIFSGLNDAGAIYMMAIPVSFILTNYFLNSKRKEATAVIFALYVIALLLNSMNQLFEFLG